ncbi:MAG TPA: hypothetical protein VFW25_10515 [Silvibacterium sp.]|nr:hypothetical protein [Silvibacterium sp.]
MANSNVNSAATSATDRNTVAGYFASSEDAHRAINELVEEGFSGSEIGAAFHGGTTFSSPEQRRSRTGETTESAPPPKVGRADSTGGGAASGTERVFPWGFATGGGTVFAGAPTNPGPIPGGEIPSTLPREIPSELPSQFDKSTSSESRTVAANTGRSEAATQGKREPASEKEALNYGTGEGHLPLSSNYDYAYSGSAFESSFSGMGVPAEHSRRLSRDLQRGGAIVTVRAGSRNSTAEAVMQRNNGVIRYDTPSAAVEPARDSGAQEPRVEVYGEIHRVYPGNIPERDVRSRKAS